jgi:hypothetical protein
VGADAVGRPVEDGPDPEAALEQAPGPLHLRESAGTLLEKFENSSAGHSCLEAALRDTGHCNIADVMPVLPQTRLTPSASTPPAVLHHVLGRGLTGPFPG